LSLVPSFVRNDLDKKVLNGNEMEKKPLYTISVVSDLMDVHPETLRVWERHGLVKPPRRNAQRLYTDDDLKRLSFIQELLGKGLNLAGVADHLSFYPCWLHDDCPKCMRQSVRQGCAKPCWREKGAFCQVSFDGENLCNKCDYKTQSKNHTKSIGPKGRKSSWSL
jgi:MerR family transcriptional regulator, heat shock protein HspR